MIHLIYISSSSTYLLSSRMERGAKSGQPLAIFIADWGGGRWNEELLGLECSVWTIGKRLCSRSRREKDILHFRGQSKIRSNSPFMTDKNMETCVPSPVPLPLRYRWVQSWYPSGAVYHGGLVRGVLGLASASRRFLATPEIFQVKRPL